MVEVSRVFQPTFMSSFSQSVTIRTPFSQSQTIPRRNTLVRCTISTGSDTGRTSVTKASVPWGCDVDSLENASALQKWLTDSGLPPQKMDIQKVEVGERGLVALNNIRKGEKLLFVPPSLVISADSEWSCSEAGDVLRRNNVPDWPLLATYLISEASFMTSSRWSSYISALPRQPYSLLYCLSISFQDTCRTR